MRALALACACGAAILGAAAATSHADGERTLAPWTPRYANITQLHRALNSKLVTCERLMGYYLARIAALDRAGPRINALLFVDPRAIDRARRLDDETNAQLRESPLFCIPFVAKDNLDSAAMPTTGGAAALAARRPVSDARVIEKLVDRGAILLGKANLSELAASHGRFGYSSMGGLTLNPYNPGRDASGSSSGSAAAVAADFAVFALGTDTSGSVRGPASVTGLIGLRPTLGLVSRNGTMPSSLSFDTAGVLARSVEDTAVLEAIAGFDPFDAATWDQPSSAPYPYAAAPPVALRGTRLGVLDGFAGGNPEVDASKARLLRTLAARGAVLVHVALPQALSQLWERILTPISEAEFKPQIERYLQTTPAAGPQTLAALIAAADTPSIRDSPQPVNPGLLEALQRADATGLTDSPTYLRLQRTVLPALRAKLLEVMNKTQVAALIFSTMSCPAAPRFDRPDPAYVCEVRDPYAASYLASATGFPEITLPAGMARAHVPMGVSLLGRPYAERRLLALARAVAVAAPAVPRPLR